MCYANAMCVSWLAWNTEVPWGGTDDTLAMCCSSTGVQSKIEGEEPRVPSELN